mmetsp:Transcript_28488/g.80390  ORF Transcript_28488/g.80390 Transcript_28488/m.80390 type:complete len:212 (-) Transcript_28488:10-645(-)
MGWRGVAGAVKAALLQQLAGALHLAAVKRKALSLGPLCPLLWLLEADNGDLLDSGGAALAAQCGIQGAPLRGPKQKLVAALHEPAHLFVHGHQLSNFMRKGGIQQQRRLLASGEGPLLVGTVGRHQRGVVVEPGRWNGASARYEDTDHRCRGDDEGKNQPGPLQRRAATPRRGKSGLSGGGCLRFHCRGFAVRERSGRGWRGGGTDRGRLH